MAEHQTPRNVTSWQTMCYKPPTYGERSEQKSWRLTATMESLQHHATCRQKKTRLAAGLGLEQCHGQPQQDIKHWCKDYSSEQGFNIVIHYGLQLRAGISPRPLVTWLGLSQLPCGGRLVSVAGIGRLVPGSCSETRTTGCRIYTLRRKSCDWSLSWFSPEDQG